MAVCESCGQTVRSVHRIALENVAAQLNRFEDALRFSVNIEGAEGEEVIHVKDVGRIGWSIPLQRWVVSD